MCSTVVLVQGSAPPCERLWRQQWSRNQAGQTDSRRAERAPLSFMLLLSPLFPILEWRTTLASFFCVSLRRHRTFFLFVFDIHAVPWRCYDTRAPAHCSCWGEEQGILGKKHKLAVVSGTDLMLLMYNGRTTELWDGISPTPSTASQNRALCWFKLRFNVLLLFLFQRYGQNKLIFHNATFVFPLMFSLFSCIVCQQHTVI